MGLVLLRFGEVALKGRNRSALIRLLRRNLRACLTDNNLEGEVVSVGQRIYVRTPQVEQALVPLSRVFGIVSLSPAVQAPRDAEGIVAECVRQAAAAGVGRGASFRVRARRVDKTFPLTSLDINRAAGEAIAEALNGPIDLSDAAAITIGVEVTTEGALVFGRVIPAPGGLPLGMEGRVVALISGGIDSPVAAWMMMKRGCQVIPLHFSQNEVETSKALDNIALLSQYSYDWTLRPTILDHHEVIGPTVRALREIHEARWSCIFCKRAMLLRACALADELDAHAVVMGDSLGQVASQSLRNLEIISWGMPKPILRPLIGLDKTEVMAAARRIGTFDISTRQAESCVFVPSNPVTVGTLSKLKRVIARLEERTAELPEESDAPSA
jgi:thiamine biosynthesis protein ThiI